MSEANQNEKAGGFTAGTLPADNAIATMLGHFVARWSLAEYTLVMPMLLLLKTRDQEMVTTILASTNSADGKVNIVRALLKQRSLPTGQTQALDAALKVMLELCKQRNSLMHHLWVLDGGGLAHTIDYRRHESAEKYCTSRTIEDIKSLANQALEVARDICVACNTPWLTPEGYELLRFK